MWRSWELIIHKIQENRQKLTKNQAEILKWDSIVNNINIFLVSFGKVQIISSVDTVGQYFIY